MVVLEVYTKNIKVRYKSTLVSKAAFLTCICELFTIMIPLMLAYHTGGFWQKQDYFLEQPQVNLLGDHLLIATTNNLSNPIVCSTYPFYKNQLDHLDLCSLIKLREIDENLDNKIDEMKIDFHLNIFDYSIESIILIMPIRYKLQTVCPLEMQSAVIYQHHFCNKVTDVHILGELKVHQKSPIDCSKGSTHRYYDNSIIVGPESEKFEIEYILEKYLERNITTQLTNLYTIMKEDIKKEFHLRLSVKYPEHKLIYRPGVWQMLKMAWIQYFATYIIFRWCSEKIKNYIFQNRLVLFYEESPLKKIL
ncbi:unnamed protein product [Phaedon cochleariae]|uniref:Transmembrane protein 231 n=1 Tax=Phaedon cochleariae TaxID=80249 RepID=A0A9P0DRD0_PHACE|nr:unnamed protein product [Phaedon cochleariae]